MFQFKNEFHNVMNIQIEILIVCHYTESTIIYETAENTFIFENRVFKETLLTTKSINVY